VSARPRAALADEGGYTIVEMVITMVVGLLVIGSSIAVLTSAMRENEDVSRRAEATQRGRNAMDVVIRELRSQVCPNASTMPVVAGDGSSITVWVDFSNGTGTPQKHVLSFDATRGELTDTITAPTAQAPRILGTGLAQSASTPVFRYYGFTAATPPDPTASLAVPLASTDLPRVARIVVTLRADPRTRASDSRLATTLSNQVFVRYFNPNDAAPTAPCA
jgi:Tfp pilus assembly protein PilW